MKRNRPILKIRRCFCSRNGYPCCKKDQDEDMAEGNILNGNPGMETHATPHKDTTTSAQDKISEHK